MTASPSPGQLGTATDTEIRQMAALAICHCNEGSGGMSVDKDGNTRSWHKSSGPCIVHRSIATAVIAAIGPALEAAARKRALDEIAHVAFKGPNDTDADYLIAAADRLDGGYEVGGSNVRNTVSRILRAVARSLMPETTK